MELDELVGLIQGLTQGGESLETVRARLQRLPIDVQAIDEAVAEFGRQTQRIRTLRTPPALLDGGLAGPWYRGPREEDLFWPGYRQVLVSEHWESVDIEALDQASSKIVGLLSPPGRTRFSTRGLVIGYVQSGKTSSFTAVIAKAADAGYRLFIVLSGMHNGLRRQTQERLSLQLVAPHQRRWFELTQVTGDFGNPGNANNLLSNTEQRLLAIVKKNSRRLRNLVRWLRSAEARVLEECPVLVIDDEADQASINVAPQEEARRTAVNSGILEILGLPRVGYLGYTATPFANLLVDPSVPEDLYPRDFIVDLEVSRGYFGPETLFGRDPLREGDAPVDGFNMIRHVDDGEITSLRPRSGERDSFNPLVTPSLDRALRYFLLATTARRVRGTGTPHSTMLVHTTVYTDVHMMFVTPLRAWLRDIEGRLSRREAGLLQEFRELWEEEQAALPPELLGERPVTFDALSPLLPSVAGSVTVVVDNYRSSQRLRYGADPVTAVVVGGNTLSRGLTLEGLIVSFFVRGASAYDTLMQMGRWFGYRRGYPDLPRIWMTEELDRYFHYLATVEREIRVDVGRYEVEGLTPREFAVRIRTHPQLAVTSALKMQRATQAEMSFSGRRVQTIMFLHRDAGWLARNLEAARDLIGALPTRPERCAEAGRWLLRSVQAEHVLAFLDTYEFHRRSYEMRRDLLRGYIAAQNARGSLLEWNIAVMGRATDARLGTIDLGLGEPVGMINRSRMIGGEPGEANIKALMSRLDRVVDLDNLPGSVARMNDRDLQMLRPRDLGLLLIYPISRRSEPMPEVAGRGERPRAPLDAVDDVIGIGLVFPEAREATPQGYVSVDLSGVQREEVEIDPEEDREPDAPAVSP